MPDEMSEQDKILVQTIRARLEWNKGKVQWKPDPDGPWQLIELKTGLVRYFEPAYQPGIDPVGRFKEEPIMGFIHVRKRRTGAKAAFKEAQRMAQYYGGQLISETAEPYIDHYQREMRRQPIQKPTRWQRLTRWFFDLITKIRGK
jgi:hypothetical protein